MGYYPWDETRPEAWNGPKDGSGSPPASQADIERVRREQEANRQFLSMKERAANHDPASCPSCQELRYDSWQDEHVLVTCWLCCRRVVGQEKYYTLLVGQPGQEESVQVCEACDGLIHPPGVYSPEELEDGTDEKFVFSLWSLRSGCLQGECCDTEGFKENALRVAQLLDDKERVRRFEPLVREVVQVYCEREKALLAKKEV